MLLGCWRRPGPAPVGSSVSVAAVTAAIKGWHGIKLASLTVMDTLKVPWTPVWVGEGNCRHEGFRSPLYKVGSIAIWIQKIFYSSLTFPLHRKETICGFIEQGKFFEACDHIYDLEHSGNDGVGKSESLYTLLAERMWTVVGEALSGSGGMFLEPLQSVGESLKWEKQKEAEWLGSSQETESVSTWSPNFWRKDLEEKLIHYMTAQIPPFGSCSNTDETALKHHLSQLEMTFIPSLEHRSGFFKEAGLLVTYTHCCHASLSSHLSTLTDSNNFSFSQCLLLYEWGLKMYKSSSETCLGPRQTPQHSLSLGVQCLVWIILKTEEKLLAAARILTEKTEAAWRVSESLSEKVEAVCLEECLRFLDRTVWHKLTYICSASTGQDVKVNGFLDRMEDEITEHFLQTVTSKVKGPAAGPLKDPIKAILELIQTSDAEGMKIALLPILKEFPSLRPAVRNVRSRSHVAASAIAAP
ncbi:exocyst complex component 3-like protein [Limosa lapponica baueri]|uniref:Exocyst complex component 3-like protein n=1 Tax=Limosa lapponica baueri TaxID=1758121 RepID=A0A2I0TQN2_LIMLA|nr:exocyst complex component 3-like protein [Limosa lapponica baueri]